MEMDQRILLTVEKGFTVPPGFELCCDECGALSRDLVELLSPKERSTLISGFKAERRQQISSGELHRLVSTAKS